VVAPALGEIGRQDLGNRGLQEVDLAAAPLDHLAGRVDDPHLDRAGPAAIVESGLHESDVDDLDAALGNRVLLGAGRRRHQLVRRQAHLSRGGKDEGVLVVALFDLVAHRLARQPLLRRPGDQHDGGLAQSDRPVALEALGQFDLEAPALGDAEADDLGVHELDPRRLQTLQIDVDPDAGVLHRSGRRQRRVDDGADDAVGPDGPGKRQ
jgi:hypothetical protein